MSQQNVYLHGGRQFYFLKNASGAGWKVLVLLGKKIERLQNFANFHKILREVPDSLSLVLRAIRVFG